MSLYLEKGSVEIIEAADLKARGALTDPCDRELVVARGFFGAWNLDGRVAPETLRRRTITGRTADAVPKTCPQEVISVSDEEVVWGGFMARHYGHFLTESVARLWAVLPDAALHGRAVVFSCKHHLRFAEEWLKAADIKVIDLPMDGAVHFKTIAVPEPALQIAAWAAPEMRDLHLSVRRKMDFATGHRSGVLWLSRSNLGSEGRAYDELLFEWLLQEHINIIHPESISLQNQVAAIEKASIVAGVLGSAFHTLLMVEDVPEYLALCSGTIPSTFVCQDALLNAKGKFLQSLSQAKVSRKMPRFPHGWRILIPETIEALCSLGVDSLPDDSRIAALVRPEHLWSTVGTHADERGLLTALAAVLLDPNSIAARTRLASFFEERELNELALEQYVFVADLAPQFVSAPLRAAQLLAKMGDDARAAVFAERVLAVDPNAPEAAAARTYLSAEGQ